VQKGEIVGRGYHRAAGLPHAEVEALRRAGAAAKGADLFVTLEPCNHQGRTPPCTEAVLRAGIRRVIIATRDPNPRVNGGGAEFLQSQGVQVETGLLADQARRLNEAWFHWVATGLPFVIAKAACSLDGKIATAGGESQWLTGEKARAYGHQLRHQVDAILVGVGTVLADDPQLTTRLPGRTTENGKRKTENGPRDPIRIVLDSRLRLPLSAKLLHLNSPAPTWIACTPAAPKDKIQALQDLGADVLVMPTVVRETHPTETPASVTSASRGLVDLQPLLQELGRRQIQNLLVEGGGETLGSFFDQRLVDKFYFFYAPKILGGKTAPGMLAGAGVKHLGEALQAKDLSVRKLGVDLLVEGYLYEYL
jgi:diaminohydroxyphosphoribosylaminopyrimidine deaminase/5-amino-6-(5-phosphoribosylamino)uracil reductase